MIAGAASTESVLTAAQHLIDAGIWTEIPGEGIDCGASEHIAAKTERIEKARSAVTARLAKRDRQRLEAETYHFDAQGGEL
jgi:hypothetical protein